MTRALVGLLLGVTIGAGAAAAVLVRADTNRTAAPGDEGGPTVQRSVLRPGQIVLVMRNIAEHSANIRPCICGEGDRRRR